MNILKNILNGKKITEPACPYCSKKLTKVPKRKTGCTFCKKEIYVRSKQKIFPSSLLTHRQAIAIDYLKFLEGYGVTAKDFINHKEQLSKKFEQEANPIDVIWGLYNKLILKTKDDLQALKNIYRQMAWLLHEEGKDPSRLLQQSAEMELLYLKQELGVKKVSIITNGEQACKACQKLNKQIILIDEALDRKPIPCKECSHTFGESKKEFCRCIYCPEVEID